MSEVFVKTRELAEAIMRSDEYIQMKAAEDVAMQNAEAAEIMSKYLERKQELEIVMTKEEPDVPAMTRLSEEMELLQKQLQETEDIANLTARRNAFTNLINQVNQVLRFTITGEIDDMVEDDENSGGCTGSCATCHACH